MALGVVPASKDSSEVTLRLAGGAGQYAFIMRGCEGEVLAKADVPFSEVSGEVSYKGTNPARFGVRGSRVMFTDTDYDAVSLNPFLSLEFESFGLGCGYTWLSDPIPWGEEVLDNGFPGGYLRFGNRRNQYCDLSVMQPDGLCTDGYLRFGVGSDANPNVGWWLGMNSGPYDGFGVGAKVDVRVKPGLYVNMAGRIGDSEGISEYNYRAGLTYRIRL